MYELKISHGQVPIGRSTGNRLNEADGSFWIIGWSRSARKTVSNGESYLLSELSGKNFSTVQIEEVGGPFMGGIRFAPKC